MIQIKRLLLTGLLSIFILFCYGQNSNKINVAELIMIVKQSDVSALLKFVENLSYPYRDSSKEANGSILYYSRELKINGNVFSWVLNKSKQIEMIFFYTYEKELYEELRKQFRNLGFQTWGIKKRNVPTEMETEDFVKEEMNIGISAKQKNGNLIEYEFLFIKM